MNEAFFFGIPLIARAASHDWARVDHLLGLTLRSILAQSDGDFRVLLAAHDVPPCWTRVADDPRFAVLRADWPPEAPTAANDDGGRKKWLVKERVRAEGGGLLMFLDADDWVSHDLVHLARTAIPADAVGAVLPDGYALDFETLHLRPFPIEGAFEQGFDRLCGSSTIGRVVPGSADPLRLDPHAVLGSHHEWADNAARRGVPLVRLAARGVYMMGSGQNHSERQGPFADWRRQVTQAVRDAGTPIDAALAVEFGQEPQLIQGR